MGERLYSARREPGSIRARPASSGTGSENGESASENYIRTPIAGLKAQRHTGSGRPHARSGEARA
jgi:hypothetical protein